MNVRTTQVPGEPAQYNGWTGAELLELIGSLERGNSALRLKALEYRSLLTRAADTLEGWVSALPQDVATEDKNLIKDLRKATQ